MFYQFVILFLSEMWNFLNFVTYLNFFWILKLIKFWSIFKKKYLSNSIKLTNFSNFFDNLHNLYFVLFEGTANLTENTYIQGIFFDTY